jgi:ribonucleoside-diphosphate reductase alpha chain
MTIDGPAQVGDLLGKPFTAVVEGKGFSVESRGFFPTGKKPICRLRTREGYQLRLTADHLVRRVRRKTRYSLEVEWAAAGSLAPGEELVLHDHRSLRGWDGAGTEHEGYLVGLLVGDGVLKQDKAVISVWAPELRKVADGRTAHETSGAAGVIAAAEAAAATLKHRADFRGFQKPVGDGRGEARMASAAIRDLALSLGLAPGAKKLTPAIERQSSGFACGFLRGLFDADGSVQGTQEKGVSVRLTQSDRGTLEGVQRMLLRLGIASTIYSGRKPALVRMMPDGRGGRAPYESQEVLELVISGDNLPHFAERIGFADGAKRDRLDTLLEGYRRGLDPAPLNPTGESGEIGGGADVL